jgi:hypothetical protein
MDNVPFSCEVLINFSNHGNVNIVKLIAMRDPSIINNVRFLFGPSAGGGGVTFTVDNFTIVGLGITADINAWCQIAVSFDGAQWIGTKNGVGAAPVVGHLINAAWNHFQFCVGADLFGSQPFEGKLAAVSWYNATIASANFLNHWNAVATSAAAYKTAVLVDAPIAFWMLDEIQTHFQRTAILTLTDGTKTIASYPGFAPVQTSNLFTWTWSVDGSGAAQNPSQTVTIVPINPVTLPPGYTVGTSTLDLTQFDQWQNIVVWADVSPSDNPPGGGVNSPYLNALLVPDYSHRSL